MIAFISGVAGVLGMLALWRWAWRLWHPRSIAHEQTKPGPPSWLFESSLDPSARDDAVARRVRPSSNTNTRLFAREQSDRAGSTDDKTEVLGEQEYSAAQTQPSVGKTCKIGLFAGPRAGHDD
jgi:hypothetical protein